MKLNFAKRMSYIKASEIREILKVTEQEDQSDRIERGRYESAPIYHNRRLCPFARMDCQPDERTFGHDFR